MGEAKRRAGQAKPPRFNPKTHVFKFELLPPEEQARLLEKTRILSSEEWHRLGRPQDRPFKPDMSGSRRALNEQPRDIVEAVYRHRARLLNQ